MQKKLLTIATLLVLAFAWMPGFSVHAGFTMPDSDHVSAAAACDTGDCGGHVEQTCSEHCLTASLDSFGMDMLLEAGFVPLALAAVAAFVFAVVVSQTALKTPLFAYNTQTRIALLTVRRE